MKKLLLVPLLFASCQFIAELLGPDRCNPPEDPLCQDDKTLRTCDANGFVQLDVCDFGCAVSGAGDVFCDQECGNGESGNALLCDDGRQCSSGTLCTDNAECAGDGDGKCKTRGGDGCREDCTIELCGDDIVDPSEGCDDGNNTAGDGCRADCRGIEACGDGLLDDTLDVLPEQCDDGNVTVGDGCNDACELELCGDGILSTNEVCEDNNTADGDGCSADCQSDESCGNGIKDTNAATPEQCDDGNQTNGDGCGSNCQLEGCGDGIVGQGESCDDGNSTNDDGCDSDCTNTCDNLAASLQLQGQIDPTTGHCYLLSSAVNSWDNAKASCETINNGSADSRGHLATITSTDENTFVRQMRFDVELWIGLNDIANEGQLRWITNERLSHYINFAGGNPNNNAFGNGQDCVTFLNNSFFWNDDVCTNVRPFVCEIDFNKRCGNGVTEANESCDDGNLNDSDTCRNDCTFNACNNTTTGAANTLVNNFSDSCFAFYNTNLSWQQAQSDCASRGGLLATASTDSSAITDERSTIDAITNANAWIGLSDLGIEGSFQWANEEGLTYNVFSFGEPNGGTGESCVEHKNDNQWNDAPCSVGKPYICEF